MSPQWEGDLDSSDNSENTAEVAALCDCFIRVVESGMTRERLGRAISCPSARFWVVRTRTARPDRLHRLKRADLRSKEEVAVCSPMKTTPTRKQLTHVCPRVPVHGVKLSAESAIG